MRILLIPLMLLTLAMAPAQVAHVSVGAAISPKRGILNADVTIRGEKRGALKAGDHFGELGLLDDTAGRSATVTANGSLRTAALTSWQFKPFLAEHPEMAWELMRTMARRINATEQHYAAAK